MKIKVPFAPEQASVLAPGVDSLYAYLVVVSVFFATLIFVLVAFFAFRYRRRKGNEKAEQIHGNTPLEIIWTVIPLMIVMSFFGWGAYLFFQAYRIPADATEIFVVGKQWMWKIQHPEGVREINELHVPVDRAVKLKMTSEDVIHDFFVPAFRMKMDVIPGRYTTAWFKAVKTGTYHLFCAEYCGTDHSKMIGSIHVLEQDKYEEWLREKAGETSPMSRTGAELFESLRCVTCHHAQSGALGPNLAGLFGTTVGLASGRTAEFNEDYIRESILKPQAKVVAGFNPVMPTYEGQVTEEQILQIIEYIKTLGEPKEDSK